jgi:hypothetical protein
VSWIYLDLALSEKKIPLDRAAYQHIPCVPFFSHAFSWYIYVHLGDVVRANVGIHIPYMEHMGYVKAIYDIYIYTYINMIYTNGEQYSHINDIPMFSENLFKQTLAHGAWSWMMAPPGPFQKTIMKGKTINRANIASIKQIIHIYILII